MTSPQINVSTPKSTSYSYENHATGKKGNTPIEAVVEMAVREILNNKYVTLGVGATAGGLFFGCETGVYTLTYDFIDKVKTCAKAQGIKVEQRDKYTDYVEVGEGPDRCKICLFHGTFKPIWFEYGK